MILYHQKNNVDAFSIKSIVTMASFPIVFIVAPKGGNPSASSETAPSVVVRQASWRATN